MSHCDAPNCPPACASPFARVVVSYLTAGGSTVHWELVPEFTDPLPYSFQLQVGQANHPEAEWSDVGAPVTNQFYALDGEQRVYGSQQWQFYRVQLTTSRGVYHSQPTGLLGTLSRRDWNLARERLRQELVAARMLGGQLGYLLKRRITGTPCPVCLDPQTREVKDPACPTCWGTGFLCGYFFPIDCVWATIEPKLVRFTLAAPRGTGVAVAVKARMLNTWMLSEEDVWVNQKTDERYYIHSIENLVEQRGVPLVAGVQMRPAPDSDPVYALAIPAQLRYGLERANPGGA